MNEFVMEQGLHVLRLVEAHPRLFRGKPPRTSCHVPTGWFVIVDKMFQDINAVLDEAEAAQFQIIQIKEKFGGLRVCQDWEFQGWGYWRPLEDPPLPGLHQGFERLFLIIEDAIRRAEQTCLRCGNPGSLRMIKGWHAPLCAAHAENPEQEMSCNSKRSG